VFYRSRKNRTYGFRLGRETVTHWVTTLWGKVMPKLADNRIPKHCLHRPSGRGYVKFPGEPRAVYTGAWESEEARRRYSQEIQRWVARGRKARPRMASVAYTVGDLADAYLEHARGYYVKHGKPTHSLGRILRVVADLKTLCGSLEPGEFGADDIDALRGLWLGRKLCRSTINCYGAHVKALFRWGLGKKLVPTEVCHLLREIPGLAKGRSGAKDNPPVLPAPSESVEAVLAYLDWKNRTLADLFRLIEASRMRPGEARIMRAADVDTSVTPWCYTPSRHKTEHLEAERHIPLGPLARAIVGPRIAAAKSPEHYLFPSPTGRRGERCYGESSLGQATRTICARLEVARWHPHQLRHSGATSVRKKFGLEGAQVILGHKQAATSQIYSQLSYNDAAEIAENMG
jgi:integrase